MANDSFAKPYLLKQVTADLERDEGFRKYAYPDPLSLLAKRYPNQKWGFKPAREILAVIGQKEEKGMPWTVGFGETGGVTVDTVMTKEMAHHKLEARVIKFAADLERVYPEWKNQPVVIQTVLLNMCYNLGAKGLASFKNTLKSITARDYNQAASNLRKSLWYTQTGVRARYLVKRVETLTIEPEHLVT